MAAPAVAVRGMRLAYGCFVVLDEVDLTVASGEIVAVIGVNGAGRRRSPRAVVVSAHEAGLVRPGWAG